MKSCKTLYETQKASRLRETIQAPHPHHIKPHYVFETKIFLRTYTEIHRHLLSKCIKNVVLGRQEMVQCKCFFFDKKQKHVCWKTCKVRKETYF